jgi:hypothetical protein
MSKPETSPTPEIPVWSPGPRGPARIYKNRPPGAHKGHLSCLACFPQNRVGQRVPLTLGCSLVLCADHRQPAFIASESGRRFLAAISTLYTSLGLSSRRFHTALMAFVDRCANPHRHAAERTRPGSYAWPRRRQAAETVWSRGGSWEQGRRAAMRAPPGEPDRRPSERTVRRWWTDRRWLGPPVPTVSARAA